MPGSELNSSSGENLGPATESGETVAEMCHLWVQRRASEMLWTRMGSERNLTETQLRGEVWRTGEGRALAALRCPSHRRC